MTAPVSSLDYPSSLQEYAVSEEDYIRQHAEYDLLVTGAVVFNKEGKLLLVQRAADEKAFPNLWVSSNVSTLRYRGIDTHRKYQEARSKTPMRPSYLQQLGN
jgi:isopentenyldiphosphate isomerase